jgi:membrane-bound ClpP family serine protease
MKFSEQPGRIFAIIFLAPYLIYCGYNYNNLILIIIGIVFFFYEIFWVIFYKPKTIELVNVIPIQENNNLII